MLFLSVIRNSQDIKIPQRTVLLMEELMGQMLTLMIILLSPGQSPTPLGLRASPFPVPLCLHRGLAAPIACGVLAQESDASALPQG